MDNIYVWKTEVYYGGHECIQKVGYGYSDPPEFAALGSTSNVFKSKNELVDYMLSHRDGGEFQTDLLKKGCFNLPTSKIEIRPGRRGGPTEIHLKKPLDDKELSDLAMELTKSTRPVIQRYTDAEI